MRVLRGLFHPYTQSITMLTNNSERDIRFKAVTLLVELVKKKLVNYQYVLMLFSRMMDREIANMKVAILARLKVFPEDALVDAIIQKGRVDNYFWVRQVARECIMKSFCK